MTELLILVCSGQRRITKGEEVNREKRYMVYFLSAEDSETAYRDWLCAGAIISPSYVLTAAACLTDVSLLYVIAGYKKYVNGMDVENDKCTSKRKRRVIQVCTPKSYSLNHENVSDWMKIDIGIATVDEPYDFNDETFRLDCSYPPDKIDINYDPYVQKAGTSAIVMGWGSRKRFRAPNDVVDNNSEYLRYARTSLKPVESCVKRFTNHTGAGEVIKQYMICSGSEGWFDIDGKEAKGSKPHGVFGCKNKTASTDPVDPYYISSGENDENENENETTTQKLSLRYNITDDEEDYFDWRRADLRRNVDHHEGDSSYENNSAEKKHMRPGFCQNDHGAPLVTWSGPKEYVIGVASATLVRTKSLLCMPPFLYTSTYNTGMFLQCVLSGSANSEIRRKCAEYAKDKGIAIDDHPVEWPEEIQDSNSNKQHQQPQQQEQQQQQENANDMKAQDYIAMEENPAVPAKTALRSNVRMEAASESIEPIDVATTVNIPVDNSKETATDDYNPLDIFVSLANKRPQKKISIEPRTFATATERDFDPYAIILEEFKEETIGPDAEKNSNEASDTPVPKETTVATTVNEATVGSTQPNLTII